MIGLEEAANLSDVPNVRQKGTQLGNWLTREQAKELLAVPDRSTLKGKRDYVIIALLVGCALRRRELASLKIEDIQLREGSWVIIAGNRRLGDRRQDREGQAAPSDFEVR
jgi:integrase